MMQQDEPPTISATVKSTRFVTPTIKEFELIPLDGQKLPRFTAGAHIDVLTNNRIYRSYSLVNSDADEDRYVIAVKFAPGSTEGSQFMHDFVDEGDVLTIRGPNNHFPLDESSTKSIFVAAGIGITPLLSMARRLQALGSSFEMHYIGRSAAEMAFQTEIAVEFGSRAKTYITRGQAGRPDIAALIPSFEPGVHLYLCGPREMIDSAKGAAAGWDSDHVHYEFFINPPTTRAPIADPADAFEIELAKSGTVLTVPEDKTILEVLLEFGIKVPSACRVGICGTCAVPVLSGRVDHRDFVLTVAEREHLVQTCVSRAKPGERLVLDR